MKPRTAETARKRLRYQTKLLLSYMLVVLVPMVVWSVLSFVQTNESLLEHANASFNDVFSSIADVMDRKLTDIDKSLSFVSTDASFARTITSTYINDYTKYYDVTYRLDPLLNTLRLLHPEILGVDLYVLNDLQKVRKSFHPVQDAASLPEFELLRNSMAAVWYFDQGAISLSTRIVNKDDLQTFPVIRLRLDDEYLFEDSLPRNFENFALSITNAQGEVLFRHSRLTSGPSEEDSDAALASLQAKGHLLYRSRVLQSTDWTLHMHMDKRAVVVSAAEGLQSTVTLVGVTALLMLLVSVLFARSFTRRIERLNSFVSRAPALRFSEDIQAPEGDDIDDIINCVGRMARNTRTLIQEVYESRIQQKEAEILALQAQINPHFLYNTLSKINWISIKKGEDDISRIVTSLSTFYRSTLNQGGSVTTVSRELTTTRAYIDIQLYINANSFDVVYDFEEAIMDFYLPNIILQPIVENAIEHGILAKEPDERGMLRLTGRRQGHDIVFTITDNGPGMSEEQITEIFRKGGKGYGVKNVNDRLRLFFDDSYGLTIRNSGEGGLIATIRVPQYIHLHESLQ